MNLHDEEFVLPRWKRTLQIANPITQQASKRDTKTIRGIPQTDPDRLLFSCVKHAGNQHKGRVGTGFSGAS